MNENELALYYPASYANIEDMEFLGITVKEEIN